MIRHFSLTFLLHERSRVPLFFQQIHSLLVRIEIHDMFCFVVFSADRFTINNLLNVLFVAVQDTIVVFPIDKYNSYFSV
jgi:hypothetical protein